MGGRSLSSARHQATLVSRSTRASDKKFFLLQVFLLWLRFKIHTKLSRGDAGEDYQPMMDLGLLPPSSLLSLKLSTKVKLLVLPKRVAERNPWQSNIPV